MNQGSLSESASAGQNALLGSAAYLLAPILNILVPHSEHVPCVAGRPFFMVVGLASLIWRWVLHFIQYPVAVLAVVVFAMFTSLNGLTDYGL
jgi:hypothetical protein